MRRSKHNLGYTHLTTMEMGKLVPFMWQDCLPNDSHFISCQAVFKAQPMIAPIMQKIHLTLQYYFVPYRLLWENWVEFITGGESGEATPEFPIMKAPPGTGIKPNTLLDYFGLPNGKQNIEFSAMLARAYTKIWNDHYKIDDIEAEYPLSLADGLDTDTNTELLNCHWARDRFTKAKPFTQRGAQVSVPIQPAITDSFAYAITLKTFTQNGASTKTKPENANIIGTIQMKKDIRQNPQNIDFIQSFQLIAQPTENNNYISISGYLDNSPSQGIPYTTYVPISIQQSEILSYSENQYTKPISYSSNGKYTENNEVVFTNVTGQIESTSTNKISTGKIGSLNIRDLRISSALQRYQEKSLKVGAEYEDFCKSEFGTYIRDSRLQKSEWLGGSQSVLQISEVIQSTDTTSLPLGATAGYGVGQQRQRTIYYRCPEHGVIIGLASIRPETLYTQGIDRELLKRNRFDYFTREFVGIGAQEILEQELFADENNKEKIFGYDLRGNYREYYERASKITGNFRTDLNYWHMGRFFESAPVLNSSFLKMNPRKDGFAIQDETLPAFLCHFQNFISSRRPIPRKVRNILK